MAVEFLVKRMVILDSGGKNLYVKGVAGSFTKIGAPYVLCIHAPTFFYFFAKNCVIEQKIVAARFAHKKESVTKLANNIFLVQLPFFIYSKKRVVQPPLFSIRKVVSFFRLRNWWRVHSGQKWPFGSVSFVSWTRFFNSNGFLNFGALFKFVVNGKWREFPDWNQCQLKNLQNLADFSSNSADF